MSVKKSGRSFGLLSEKELIKIVRSALRKDFAHHTSSIKKIGEIVPANLESIRNWYNAKNAPSAVHLLTIAKHSRTLQRFVISYILGEDIWEDLNLILSIKSKYDHINQDKNVPINVPINLNERQKWFLLTLKRDQISAQHLADYWNIDIKTARRDIKILKEAEMICFTGSRKTGRYEIICYDEY